MHKISSLLLISSLLVPVALQPVFADDWRSHGDIHNFHNHDFEHWRHGHWLQAFHEGRNGWWWVVDGIWYFYPAPVYPYPDPYTPPTIVVETAPAIAGAPSYVYYCANPAGYYPYVPQCYAAWQKVASTNAAAPAAQPPPAVAMVPAPQSAGSQRDIDYQKLNVFAAEFQNADLKDGHVRERLKNLAAQVEAFRKSLYDRNYNAMSLLKDAEDLQHRIAAQRAKLAKHPAATPNAAPMPPANAVMPEPSIQTPGATPPFVPQQ